MKSIGFKNDKDYCGYKDHAKADADFKLITEYTVTAEKPEKRVNDMCNISMGFLEEGISIGEARGIGIGKAEGISIGKHEAKSKAFVKP